MLLEETIKWLERIEREGINRRRYDKLDNANTWATKHYNETESVFIYDWKSETGEIETVVIIKQRGQIVDYYWRK